jgi:hypothetical protein
MRCTEISSCSPLRQALSFCVELLRLVGRRRTRQVSRAASRLWQVYRPAHLPLYVLAAVVGVAVVVLVMTAWLRVVMTAR